MLDTTDVALVVVGLILFVPLILMFSVSRKMGDKNAVPAFCICSVLFGILLGSMGFGKYLSDEVDHEVLYVQGGSTFADRGVPDWLSAMSFSWYGHGKGQQPDEFVVTHGNALWVEKNYRYAESVYWGAVGFYQRPESMAQVLQNIRSLAKDDHKIVARAFAGLGKVYTVSNKFPQAEVVYLQAINTYGQTTDRAGLAATKNNFGILLHKEGKQKEAEQQFQAALADSRAAHDDSMTAAIHRNLVAMNSGVPMVSPSRAIKFGGIF